MIETKSSNLSKNLIAWLFIGFTFGIAGCNQNRYEPAPWRKERGYGEATTLPKGSKLPGTSLPGTSLPGTSLPGTSLPTVPGDWRGGTTLPGTSLPN